MLAKGALIGDIDNKKLKIVFSSVGLGVCLSLSTLRVEIKG